MIRSAIAIFAIHIVAVYSDERDEFFSSVFSAVMSSFPTDFANHIPSSIDWDPSFPTAAPTSIVDSTDDQASTHDHERKGLNPGIIAAAAVGSGVGVAIIIAAIVLLYRRHQNVSKMRSSVSHTNNMRRKRVSKVENTIPRRNRAEKTAATIPSHHINSQSTTNNGSHTPNSHASTTVVGSQAHLSDFYRQEVPHAFDDGQYHKQLPPGLGPKTLLDEVPHTVDAMTYYQDVPHAVESTYIQQAPRAYFNARKPDALNLTSGSGVSSAPRLILKPVKPDGA